MASVAKPMDSPLETLDGNSRIIAKRSSECKPTSDFRSPMKTRILAAALLIPLSIAEGMAQVPEDAVTQGRGAFQRAQSAYLQKDYQAYRKAMVEAVRLRPRQPTYLYNLAGAEALTGHPEEALKWLQRVAAMGMALPAAQDDDFTSLRGTAGFAKA